MLVTMAEIDALKYKMVVRSMDNAFGVQRPEPVDEILKGTSVVKQTFSTAKPESTPLAEVRQTTEDDKQALKVNDAALYQAAKLKTLQNQLQQALAVEISEDLLSLESLSDRVLIRINEQASFPSALATLKSGFLPVLGRIAEALSDIDAEFVVAGHTDNVPLRSAQYRSNWELSAARATSVVHALLDHPALRPDQFRIEGYADTQPLVANNTVAERAMNRRVEIGIIN
jgi:chemotaxis protein MotB